VLADAGVTLRLVHHSSPLMLLRLPAALLLCCILGHAKAISQRNESGDVEVSDRTRSALSTTAAIAAAGFVAASVTMPAVGFVSVAMPAVGAAVVSAAAGGLAYYLTGAVYDVAKSVIDDLRKLLQWTVNWLVDFHSTMKREWECHVMSNEETVGMQGWDDKRGLEKYFLARTCLKNAKTFYKSHDRECLQVSSVDVRSECVSKGQELQASILAAKDLARAQSAALQSCYGYSEKDLDQLFRNYWDNMRDEDDGLFDAST
jgi:hypothetical protein